MESSIISQLIAQRTKATEWFLDARFGMFIHWGLYAIPARGEWVRNLERISNEDYQGYFDEFEPIHFDPGVWAKAAKEAGMKYAVLTAKHHDGFCLFDSKLTNYTSTNTKAGKDLVLEFVEAFRVKGIKVGLYYSLLDWHHEDYPAYSDSIHPMRGNEEYKNKHHNFENYLDYMHGQIRELCLNYGKIDIMWFDFSYDEMRGEKWRATELIHMVRSLQPGVIINNRLEASGEFAGTIKTRNPSVNAGDFASPEQMIPPKGIVDEDGNSIPWEANFTLNNNWGYSSADKIYKTSRQIIRKLVECVSKNGNMLLNVGPNAKGEIPVEALRILEEVGNWMKHHSKSIYDCGQSQFSKPEWGYYTQNGKFLYAHIFEPGIGPLALCGLSGKFKKARLISDGSEIKVIKPWNTNDYPDDAFINFGQDGLAEQFTFSLPDDMDTVVELELL